MTLVEKNLANIEIVFHSLFLCKVNYLKELLPWPSSLARHPGTLKCYGSLCLCTVSTWTFQIPPPQESSSAFRSWDGCVCHHITEAPSYAKPFSRVKVIRWLMCKRLWFVSLVGIFEHIWHDSKLFMGLFRFLCPMVTSYSPWLSIFSRQIFWRLSSPVKFISQEIKCVPSNGI